MVTDALADSSMFASRFRECAARALLLPRRDPGRRAPLWQQRQRSAQLLSVASQFPDFPIILETVRECLQDVYDLPSLTDLLTRIRSRRVRLTEVETPSPSPFAASLLFGYVGAFTLLALVLREGMALGVAYGIWGAMGVALTAVLAALLFGQPLTGVMILGLALIIGGVLTVELGSQAAQRKKEANI